MSAEIIELTEYEPFYINHDQLDYDIGRKLHLLYSNYIDIEFPSPKTEGKWKMQSLGWVGTLRLENMIVLNLKPKIQTQNLFAMWEYAYRLKSFRIMDNIIPCDTIVGFYNQIASLLSKNILMRCRKGLYKSYEEFSERLSYITGKIDILEKIMNPFDVKIKCDYQDNTINNFDNQILLYTLYVMLNGKELNLEVNHITKQAYMFIQGKVDLIPVYFTQCINRDYNSLNNDYQMLHSLCRFILEYTGPSGLLGQQMVLPFIVDMSRLFELFVAEWLKINLPDSIGIKAQEKISFGENDKINYSIDIILYRKINGNIICALDTKYKKSGGKPQNSDINQMVAYTEALNCTIGILLYPYIIIDPHKYRINTKIIWQMGFDISGDINEEGNKLIKDIVDKCNG